jgi:hypothetical protein
MAACATASATLTWSWTMPGINLVAQGCTAVWRRPAVVWSAISNKPQVPVKCAWPSPENGPLAPRIRQTACLRARLGNPLESRIMLPSRDREGVVADSFSDLSILKMAHWLLARSHFHGSIVSRRLMTNCAIFLFATLLFAHQGRYTAALPHPFSNLDLVLHNAGH